MASPLPTEPADLTPAGGAFSGTTLRFSTTHTTDGTTTFDPTTLLYKVWRVGLAVTTKTYGTDADLVRDSEGNFHYDHTFTVPGTYYLMSKATDSAGAISQFTSLVVISPKKVPV